MKIGEVQIVGIVPNEKNGKVSYSIYGVTPFEDYETERGGMGMKSIQEWTNRVDCSVLKPGDIVRVMVNDAFDYDLVGTEVE